MADAQLHAEEILKLEFEYARETAAEAQSDRTTIVNLYLILVGGVGSIVLGLPRGLDAPPGAYALLFALLAVIGFFTLLKLIRLRQAWYESVRAMNTIKDFYLKHFTGLEPAFLWKVDSIPALGKPWTITFNLSILVMIIDCAALAVAVHFTGIRTSLGDYIVDVFAAIVFFLWQLWFYFFQLSGSTRQPE